MTTTAIDYLREQEELEREARELMPYDPKTCTYELGELRQPVFACLTCSESSNQDTGVCYSCSIQCHSTHKLVELFAKRSFTCDCGTTRSGSECKLRQSINDIPSSSNLYNQNYKGLFCSCSTEYDPNSESCNMIQCYFGFACGEDWYHETCIPGISNNNINGRKFQDQEINKDSSDPTEKDNIKPNSIHYITDIKDKHSNANIKVNIIDNEELKSNDTEKFPSLDSFDVFICWKCVSMFPDAFEELKCHSCAFILTHKEQGNELTEPSLKKRKKADLYSVFLKEGFRSTLNNIASDKETPLAKLLRNNKYLFENDPIHEDPEDEASSTSSLLDLGAEALQSLPREKAIEGIEALNKIKSKLKDFFRPFAEEGRVVTEEEVKDFFSKVTEEK